jgi:glucose dehydrogenase
MEAAAMDKLVDKGEFRTQIPERLGLWETELPFSGTATPATYMVHGKQYIVIETNNLRNRRAPQGAAYVAYALP